MKNFLIPTVKFSVCIAAACIFSVCLLSEKAMAQNDVPGGVRQADTLSVPLIPPVDSAMVGVSVFDLIKSDNIVVHQDLTVKNAFDNYLQANQKRARNGYRIIVYSSNVQSARGESDAISAQFREAYPGLGVYRTYSNPFFKVTVGDFRTKTDALKLYNEILGRYPRAKIVKDKIDWYQFE